MEQIAGLAGGGEHRQPLLQLDAVAGHGGQQRVAGRRGAVPPPRRGPGRGRHAPPQHGTRVRQPQMDVAMGGQGAQDGQLDVRQSGRAEDGQPRRQLGRSGGLRVTPQPVEDVGEPFGRTGPVDTPPHPAPQLRLPGQIGRRLAVVPGQPGQQQIGTLLGVGAEQGGQPSGDSQAASDPGLVPDLPGGVGAPSQMAGQRCAPGLIQALVDDGQYRPGERVHRPGIVLGVEVQRRGKDRGDHTLRGGETHPGAYPRLAVRTGPQVVREPLREPPLHPAGGDGDHLGPERIVRSTGEHRGERFHQRLGIGGAVQVQHPTTLAPPPVTRSERAGRRTRRRLGNGTTVDRPPTRRASAVSAPSVSALSVSAGSGSPRRSRFPESGRGCWPRRRRGGRVGP